MWTLWMVFLIGGQVYSGPASEGGFSSEATCVQRGQEQARKLTTDDRIGEVFFRCEFIKARSKA